MALDTAPQDAVAAARQPYPLPPDVRYVLDQMLNDSMLDEGSYLALNLFVPRAPLLAIIDDNAKAGTEVPLLGPETPREEILAAGGRTLDCKRRIAVAVLDLVDRVLPGLPQEVRNGIAAASLGWLRRDLASFAWCLSDWTFEDETTGGGMKPFRDRPLIHRSGDVYRRSMRRLLSPAFISRTVKAMASHREVKDRRAMATRILNRVERATELEDRLSSYAAEMENQRQEAERAGMLRFLQDAEARSAIDKRPRLKRRGVRRRRAVIRRSLRVATTILGAETVSRFVRGDGVRLPGSALDLVVRLDGPLSMRGHGLLDVKAVRPGGDDVLAGLCVYHERMPPLDQLAGLALAMGAGEEAEVVSDANIVMMFPAGREVATLAERERRSIARPEDWAEPAQWRRVDRSRWSHEERRARADQYWQQTKAIWIERLAVYACGRRVKLLGDIWGTWECASAG